MKRSPTFVFYQDAAGSHRWRVVAPNGRVLADSAEGYSSRGKCGQAAVKVLRATLVRKTKQ